MPAFFWQGRRNDGTGIERIAKIVGSGIQRPGPHFFISHSMVANDADASKLLGQRLQLSKAHRFHVEDDGERTVPGDAMPEFNHGAGNLYAMDGIGQRPCEQLRNLGVALEEKHVDLLHNTLAECRSPRRLKSGKECLPGQK
jgi:hypothetical protein